LDLKFLILLGTEQFSSTTTAGKPLNDLLVALAILAMKLKLNLQTVKNLYMIGVLAMKLCAAITILTSD